MQAQCAKYLRPLFRLLRSKRTPQDVLQRLERIMLACHERNYVKAADEYIMIAIGNAPWPMGVTMVSIHERAGREKLFNQSNAHVLNDEEQRKYFQSVKRLMTYCQRKYPPTDPTKAMG